MYGDFSRNTFNARHSFCRVLMQQGRVQLDADWNEQAAIHQHYLQILARDLIGPHGGPHGSTGFAIASGTKDFRILPGRYYVQGQLLECHQETSFTLQPNDPAGEKGADLETGWYLIYLEASKRAVSHWEFDNIREKALGGPDTARREMAVWRVKSHRLSPDEAGALNREVGAADAAREIFAKFALESRAPGPGQMRVNVVTPTGETEPCAISPKNAYRGLENQLYRVEIHDGGQLGTEGRPSFKWSRDNGAVEFGVATMNGGTAQLHDLGKDERYQLTEGNLVEVLTNQHIRRCQPGPMVRVSAVDPSKNSVSLTSPDGDGFPGFESDPVLLRRWEGIQMVTEQSRGWQDLEDGIAIQFQPEGFRYHPGDYWQIPARTATGSVEWPNGEAGPLALPPQNRRDLAPLWVVEVNGDQVTAHAELDLRAAFPAMAQPILTSNRG